MAQTLREAGNSHQSEVRSVSDLQSVRSAHRAARAAYLAGKAWMQDGLILLVPDKDPSHDAEGGRKGLAVRPTVLCGSIADHHQAPTLKQRLDMCCGAASH